ncbi:PhnD/SsuA/transferrin family substrate-binding protein [Streptosporangium sp. NPDC049644]|uniref:PhnD/SsuA/transferrin family substrate-binding protein n=1 Tax=Streptosporangium sp. NPDC049644 TaxID=3155507 RepID=UPI00342A7053
MHKKRNPSIRRALVAFTAAVVAGSLLTGCSSDKDGSGSPKDVSLKVGIATQFFQIAWDEGQNRPEYRVDFSRFDGAGPVFEALGAKSIDFGFGSDLSIVSSQANGAKFKIFAVAKPNPDWLRLLVPRNSAVQSLSELKGKRIAVVRGSAAHRFVVGEIENLGLGTDDFELAFLSTPDAQAAFLRGDVDAWASWEPNSAQVEIGNGARLIQTATETTAGNIYFAANQGFFEGDRHRTDATKDFLKKFIVGLNKQKADTGNWAKVLAEKIDLPLDVATQFAKNYSFTFIPIDDSVKSDYTETAKVLQEQGIIKNAPDVATAFDEIANEAVISANGEQAAK